MGQIVGVDAGESQAGAFSLKDVGDRGAVNPELDSQLLGPASGLIGGDVASVRAHLLEMQGDLDAARAAYRYAARLTTSVPERRHLLSRATHPSLRDRPMDRG